MLALWRGEQLLGELHLRLSSDSTRLEAVLLPRGGTPPPVSFMQSRITLGDLDFIGGRQVPALAYDDVDKDLGPNLPRSTNLTPIPAGRPLGIPASEQLTLRDEAGAVIPCRGITLLEHRIARNGHDPEIETFPSSAIVGRSIWLVWLTPETPYDAEP